MITIILKSEKGNAALTISIPNTLLPYYSIDDIVKKEQRIWNNVEWKVRVYGKLIYTK